MKYLIILSYLVLICSSCTKLEFSESSDTISQDINEVKPIWSKSMSDGSDYVISTTGLNYYEDKVLFSGIEKNQEMLYLLDVNTGDIMSSWNSTFRPAGIMRHNHQNNSLFLKGKEIINFDMNLGEPKWIIERNTFNSINNFGIGNTGFIGGRLYKDDFNFCICIYTVDLVSGSEPELVTCPKYSLEEATANGFYGNISNITPFIEDGDTLLFVGFDDSYSPLSEGFWGIYNLTQNEWEVEKVLCEERNRLGGVGYSIHYYEGRFYFSSGKSIQCWDRNTYEMLWKKEFSNTFGSGTRLVEEHNVIVGCNNVDALSCLDIETGNVLWINDATKYGSLLHYQDDVIYIAGGSSGKLHAIDVVTGEDIWEIESPDTRHDSQAYFSRQINGIPAKDGEKGKIFVSSYLSAFCYEAVN